MVDPYDTHPDLLTGTFTPQRLRNEDSIFRCWLEQTVSSLAALSFLRQLPSVGLVSSLGYVFELLEIISVFCSLISSYISS